MDIQTTGVNKNFGQPSRSPCTIFSIHTLTKIDDSWPDCKSPAEVPQTVIGRIKWKGVGEVWVNRVSYEATSCMCVKADHEEECEVVCIPERLKALFSNLVMGGCVHDKHDQKHEVTSNATRLRIVYLLSGLFPNF